MNDFMKQSLIDVLDLISQGYKVKGVDDRYITVENPKFQPDIMDSDPYKVIDVHDLKRQLFNEVEDLEDVDLPYVMRETPQPVYMIKIGSYERVVTSVVPLNEKSFMISLMDGEYLKYFNEFSYIELYCLSLPYLEVKHRTSSPLLQDEFVWKCEGRHIIDEFWSNRFDNKILILYDLKFEMGLGTPAYRIGREYFGV